MAGFRKSQRIWYHVGDKGDLFAKKWPGYVFGYERKGKGMIRIWVNNVGRKTVSVDRISDREEVAA